MTSIMDAAPVAADETSVPVSWARVDEGFFVGSRAGEFVGYIEQRAPKRFAAYSGRSTPVGEFGALADAMSGLSAS